MKYAYITGASQGIGQGIAKALLATGKYKVIGISRRKSIDDANYKHISADLSDPDTLEHFEFEEHPGAQQIVLVNNAGMLGNIHHLGSLKNRDIINAYTVNLIAPAVLSNKFMARYSGNDAEQLIINVTSGAATSPYDGWSVYCSSKAGLDMLTKVNAEEQKTNSGNKVTVLGIAPGVVDTEMQTQIRGTDESGFSRKEKFVNLKQNNELYDPQAVGKRFAEIIQNPEQVHDLISRISL